jgi:hypothetical protein
MVHAWVEHIRQYAKEHNLTYPNAMKDPNCKATYKSKKSVVGSGQSGRALSKGGGCCGSAKRERLIRDLVGVITDPDNNINTLNILLGTARDEGVPGLQPLINSMRGQHVRRVDQIIDYLNRLHTNTIEAIHNYYYPPPIARIPSLTSLRSNSGSDLGNDS